MADFLCTEAEELVRNAELRTELEPYSDDAVSCVCLKHKSLRHENDFLASMLDWEVSPADPIAQWFKPALALSPPEKLDEKELSHSLEQLLAKLFKKKVVLDFTNHLSDRELYILIYRSILPSREKNLQHRNGYMHWDCSCGDHETWLRYYASDEEREQYKECSGEPLPRKEVPPYHRDLPQCAF